MSEEITKKQLVTFLLIFSAIFFGFGYHFYGSESQNVSYVLLGLGLLFVLVSIFAPRIMIPFYKVWVVFGNFIGKINSYIIIFLLYFVIFLPIGILLKIFRYDPLRKKINKSIKSYWVEPDAHESNMKYQF